MQNLEPEPLPENKPSKKEKPMQIPSKRAIARRAGINPGSLDYALKAMQAGKSTPAVVKVARVMERMGVTLEMLAGQAPPEPEAPREEEAAEAEPQEAAVPEVEPEPGPEPEVASEPEPEPEPTQEAEPDSEAEPRSEMEPCDDTLSRIEAELAAEEEGTGQTRPLSLYPWEDLAREITRRMPPGSEVTLRA
jgi:hypothetical protein